MELQVEEIIDDEIEALEMEDLAWRGCGHEPELFVSAGSEL